MALPSIFFCLASVSKHEKYKRAQSCCWALHDKNKAQPTISWPQIGGCPLKQSFSLLRNETGEKKTLSRDHHAMDFLFSLKQKKTPPTP